MSRRLGNPYFDPWADVAQEMVESGRAERPEGASRMTIAERVLTTYQPINPEFSLIDHARSGWGGVLEPPPAVTTAGVEFDRAYVAQQRATHVRFPDGSALVRAGRGWRAE